MIQVLGDESEPTSKYNPVQTTPIPIQLLEVLLTLTSYLFMLTSDQCWSVIRLRMKLKASYVITNLLNKFSYLVRTQAYIKMVAKSQVAYFNTAFPIGIVCHMYSNFSSPAPKHCSNNTFHLASHIN